MGRIPWELRKNIATNIRAERMKQYPGRGGSRKCADLFGVSPQQWSPWECGQRTPDEPRLQEIADFFGVTVEYMVSDHSMPENSPESASSMPGEADCPELPGMTRAESDIIWQLRKMYSGLAADGERVHVSLNIVLSKDAEQGALASEPLPLA